MHEKNAMSRYDKTYQNCNLRLKLFFGKQYEPLEKGDLTEYRAARDTNEITILFAKLDATKEKM